MFPAIHFFGAFPFFSGLETVKSLQMEPQLNARYSDYLAEYLRSGFGVRQIGNTYNVISNGLEQNDCPAHPGRGCCSGKEIDSELF